ncbi:MAG: S8 family serine peptidase [Candidatus Kapabacteria bacterium]|nr:S8 family serine peptidase [Candidatus Kapabacteria bacterium]
MKYFLLFIYLLQSSFLSASSEFKKIILKTENQEIINQIQKEFPKIKIDNSISLFRNINKKNSNLSVLSADQVLKIDKLKKYYTLYIPPAKYSQISAFLNQQINPTNFEQSRNFHIDTYPVPNDSLFGQQWGLQAVNALGAWEKASGKGIVVGVVDTGLDWTNSEFAGQLRINSAEDINHNGKFDAWPSTQKINGVSGDLDGIDQDGNGFADDVIGYDFVNEYLPNIGDALYPDPLPTDEQGHGTKISSIIVARQNNAIGISGLAYNSKLVVLRALDATGNGESDNIASAIVYAALNGVNVLNFSFGESYPAEIMHDAIKFAYSMGVVMFASAGNEGSNYPHYPSDYDEVISVGSCTEKIRRDGLTNYGSHLAFLAPGTNIYVTKVGGSFEMAAGTSVAAPFAAATAALMLEKNPKLTPDAIKSVLQSTAFDIGAQGWDTDAGNGLINASAAVNFIGSGNIKFSSPQNDDNIIYNKAKIPILGNCYNPLFDSYQLLIGRGFMPSVWDSLNLPQKLQKISDTLGFIDFSKVRDTVHRFIKNKDSLVKLSFDTVYTLRLLVKLKNFNSIEERIYIYAVDTNKKLQIDNFKVITPYFNDKKIALVSCQTSALSSFKVRFRKKGSNDPYLFVNQTDHNSFYHYLTIESEIVAGLTYQAQAIVTRSGTDSAIKDFEFMVPKLAFNYDKMKAKSSSIITGYYNNSSFDLYSDKKNCLAMTDYAEGSFGKIKTYEYNNNKFNLKDSLLDGGIVCGFGDSNGDGIPEILVNRKYSTYLYQAKKNGDNPFSSLIYSDTSEYRGTAAALVDIDLDGKPDIIEATDSSYRVYSFKNNKYSFLAEALNPEKSYKFIGTHPGLAVGDFDGNGKMDLCFGDNYGNIFIFEYSNGTFNRTGLFEFGNAELNNYICSGDFDADGKQEILVANYGSTKLFTNQSAPDMVWEYMILKPDENHKYNIMWNDYVFGVRTSIYIRRGVAAGNIDGKPGDEAILSPFPYLYVLKWNPALKQMEPFWAYPFSFSNTAMTQDFDSNGINELGFSNYNNTVFFETDSSYSGPDAATAFEGWATSNSTIHLRWQEAANAKSYIIYKLRVEGTNTVLDSIAVATGNSIDLDNLETYTVYDFVIRSFNQDMKEPYGNFSYIPNAVVEAYTHDMIYPYEVKAINKYQLSVQFTGRLSANAPDASEFSILKNNFLINKAIRTVVASDSVIIVTFENPFENNSYQFKGSSFRDFYYSPTIDTIFSFDVNITSENKSIYLKSLKVNSYTKIALTYSEAVDKISAENIDNYTLAPKGTIVSIKQSLIDNATVEIGFQNDGQLGPYGEIYSLTVKNVKSITKLPITDGAGSTVSFVFSSTDINSGYLFPNPLIYSTAKNINFGDLPPRATIYILTQDGRLLRTISVNDGTGGCSWDGLDANGNQLNSGIYLFQVLRQNSDGSTDLSDFHKFAVVK